MPVARDLVKRASSWVDAVSHPPVGVTVLIYHRVGRRNAIEVDLPSELFDEQMAWLGEHCDVVTLDDALDSLRAAPSSPNPRVVVTFDDGTADFADEVLPVAVRHKMPITLYVATAFIEEQRDFPDRGAPLSWAALADGVQTGLLEVGSHTHTHALLDRADGETVIDELDRSIGLIHDRLGLDARHFAYPKAVLGSPQAQHAVRQRFRSAALAGTRPNRYGRTDPHRLSRTPIQVSDGMRWFERKARGGMHVEDALRRQLNRYRYRGKTA
ncbi:MAG: polysaccharide deacetylase family protein [Actinobacteria bacterium]|nr:polysaccharide deacetylase family protein [Actinomycetota bacterium]